MASSVQERDIVASFLQLRHDIKSDEATVAKCLEICQCFGLGADQLLYKWEAHMDKLGLEESPKLEHFEAIRNDIKRKVITKEEKSGQVCAQRQPKSAKPYDKSSLEQLKQNLNSKPTERFKVKLESQSIPGTPQSFTTPMKRKGHETASSLMPSSARPRVLPPTPRSSDHDAAAQAGSDDSPDAARYLNREHKFKILSVFNEALSAAPRQTATQPRCEIKLIQSVPKHRFMYEKVENKCFALRDRLRNITDGIIDNHQLKMTCNDSGESSEFVLSPVNMASQARVWCCGRVCVDGDVGTLNEFSVALEGANGRRVKLDLGGVTDFSLFPGQIVVVEGNNPTGNCLVAHAVYCDASLPMAQSSAGQIADYNESPDFLGGDPMSIVVAAGPFTTSGDLSYKPLDDLLEHLRGSRPDVLILCGPFVDPTHRLLDPATAGTPGGFSNGDPPDSVQLVHRVFREHLIAGLKQIGGIKCVVVPCLNDLHSTCVFPQPAFEAHIINPGPDNQYDSTEILPLLLSNPCTFRVNEVTISISTMDVLLHLSGNEASRLTGDRLSRLSRHLIQQRSFYPLFPAAEGAQLSMANIQHLSFQITPDVLILPSHLNSFAKRAGEVLCINPGRLTKGSSAGTFVQMSVHPIIRNIRSKSTRTLASNNPIEDNKLALKTENNDQPSATVTDVADSVCGDSPSGVVTSESIMPQQLAQNFDTMETVEEAALAENASKEGIAETVPSKLDNEVSDQASAPSDAGDKSKVGPTSDVEVGTQLMLHRVLERTRVEIVRL